VRHFFSSFLPAIILRVFVMGATGFIGSTIVQELLTTGHQVRGLSRSKQEAAALLTVYRGNTTDLGGLRQGLEGCDGVIHTAFNHDFPKFGANA
jgi:nucleoside-diphosphate-sugar epimerase